MSRRASIASRVAASRKQWPHWANRTFDAVVAAVPERVAVRLNPRKYGFRSADVPAVPAVPDTSVRLYIAPVNFAGQGFQWARAAERLSGVGAVSMAYPLEKEYGYAIDNRVPVAVFRNSRRWQKRQFDLVASRFSHVIVEAERPLFGALFDFSPVREAAELRRHGVQVAMLAHGSDLRSPERHRSGDRWSPFLEEGWTQAAAFETATADHRRILEEIAAPVFVATPDLLLDWPEATWLPIVVDPRPWAGADVPLQRERPLVVHAPSSAVIKGSDLIEPIVSRANDAGLIEYRRVEGVPSSAMPALYREADVVLDQFRIGNYATAAIEAMAAGRIVVGHVHDQVRDHVKAVTGLEVPVVQATVDTLDAVLADIVERPDHYRAIAATGPAFAARVHDGDASADALRSFLRP